MFSACRGQDFHRDLCEALVIVAHARSSLPVSLLRLRFLGGPILESWAADFISALMLCQTIQANFEVTYDRLRPLPSTSLHAISHNHFTILRHIFRFNTFVPPAFKGKLV
jgi:hypothetical protein